MITHNGTYLLHATHHGMPIYAATMGGKMVIGWLQSATLQAIVAAFGAEGTEVIAKTNDYLNRIATTDPQRALLLAGFINEDPLLVCSLVETSKTRWLVGDGALWFKLPVIITRENCNTLQIKARLTTIATSSWRVNGKGSGNTRYFGIGSGNTFAYGNSSDIETNTSATAYIGKPLDYDLDYFNGKYEVKHGADIIHQNTFTPSAVTGSNPLSLFAWNNGSTAGNIFAASVAVAEYGFANEVAYRFVPFNDHGTICLLDIVSLTTTEQTGNGIATIQLTDKTPA